jgi:leader peptidase (prepilin peptidase)/N-methyltransferase
VIATEWPLLAMFFLIGAAIGSFLNVCIARWPFDQSVISPPSKCPHCNTPIKWYDNVPVVGWLQLGGKCRNCRAPISVVYPAVELVVALGWLLCAMTWGPSLTAVRVAVFGTIMFGIAVTDAKHYLIPDGFTVFGFVFVLATAVYGGMSGEVTPFALPADAFLGACVGAGAIRIIGWLGEVILKKEAMGFGDETLMAVVGAALGPSRSLIVIFLGAAIGAVTFLLVVYPIVRLRHRRNEGQMELELGEGDDEGPSMPQVPFGVFLAPAAVLALVFGQRLTDWYSAQLMGVS